MNVKHSIYTFGCSEVSKTTSTSTVAKSCFDIPGFSWEGGWQRLQMMSKETKLDMEKNKV